MLSGGGGRNLSGPYRKGIARRPSHKSRPRHLAVTHCAASGEPSPHMRPERRSGRRAAGGRRRRRGQGVQGAHATRSLGGWGGTAQITSASSPHPLLVNRSCLTLGRLHRGGRCGRRHQWRRERRATTKRRRACLQTARGRSTGRRRRGGREGRRQPRHGGDTCLRRSKLIYQRRRRPPTREAEGKGERRGSESHSGCDDLSPRRWRHRSRGMHQRSDGWHVWGRSNSGRDSLSPGRWRQRSRKMHQRSDRRHVRNRSGASSQGMHGDSGRQREQPRKGHARPPPRPSGRRTNRRRQRRHHTGSGGRCLKVCRGGRGQLSCRTILGGPRKLLRRTAENRQRRLAPYTHGKALAGSQSLLRALLRIG